MVFKGCIIMKKIIKKFTSFITVTGMIISLSGNTLACSISNQRAEQVAEHKWMNSARSQIAWAGDGTDIRICVKDGNNITVISPYWYDDPYEGQIYGLDWNIEGELGNKVEVKFNNHSTISAKDDEIINMWRYTY